jgi:hypothetical protein
VLITRGGAVWRYDRTCAPDKGTITIDGRRLQPATRQTVVPHGLDRNLSVDDIGGVQRVGPATSTGA